MGSRSSKCCLRRTKRTDRGRALIELMVAMCLLMALALFTLGKWGPAVQGGSGGKQSTAKQVMDRAYDTTCIVQLSQFRQAAAAGGLYGDPTENSGPPRSAAEIGSPSEMRCPLCGLPYHYDPAQYGNGKYGLSCRYPKHRNL